jgi:hypothetical protein
LFDLLVRRAMGSIRRAAEAHIVIKVPGLGHSIDKIYAKIVTWNLRPNKASAERKFR